jgi:hypothetical protein
LAVRPQPATIAQIDNTALRKNTATLKVVFTLLLPNVWAATTVHRRCKFGIEWRAVGAA